MKCPKCGYLGFEPTDRCRNCGYDFSLSAAPADPELSLNDQAAGVAVKFGDFDLVAPNASTPPSLDLDRVFGADPSGETSVRTTDDRAGRSHKRAARHTPHDFSGADAPAPASSDLPFDDLRPAPPPRASRPPLGVRRTTPDAPRARPRTTRPIRIDSPQAEADGPMPGAAMQAGAPAGAERAPVGARLAAMAIDAGLLTAVGLAVLVLTLRMVGLSLSGDDLRLIPPIPFAGFLVVMWTTYLATFTVAGGQTIGKMLMQVRVTGIDGRAVDLPGSILRAAACLLVPITLGLTYVPALFTADQRALHDRLAGTRVVPA